MERRTYEEREEERNEKKNCFILKNSKVNLLKRELEKIFFNLFFMFAYIYRSPLLWMCMVLVNMRVNFYTLCSMFCSATRYIFFKHTYYKRKVQFPLKYSLYVKHVYLLF